MHRPTGLEFSISRKDRQALIPGIGNVNLPILPKRDANGFVERTIAAFIEFKQEFPIRIEHKHALVAGIGDINPSIGSNCNPARPPEAICPIAGLSGMAPLEQEFARLVEFLDAVIPGISHKHVAGGTDGNAPRLLELPGGVAFAAPLTQKAPVGRQDLHAMVLAVGHIDVAISIEGDALRRQELAGAVAETAKYVAASKQEVALGSESQAALMEVSAGMQAITSPQAVEMVAASFTEVKKTSDSANLNMMMDAMLALKR